MLKKVKDKVSKYLYTNKKGALVVKGGAYVDILIPESYLTSGFLKIKSKTYNVMSQFYVNFYDNPDRVGKPFKSRFIYAYPVELPYEKMVEKTINFEKHFVLQYDPGDIVIATNIIPLDSTAAFTYTDAIVKGKMPDVIPYDMLLTVWDENLKLGKINVSASRTVLEMMLMTFFRNPNDIAQPFKDYLFKSKNYSDKLLNDRVSISSKEIIKRSSVFGTIISNRGNPGSGIYAASNRTSDGKKEPFNAFELALNDDARKEENKNN